MSTANLSRADARARSAALTVADYVVRLDLRGAPDPDRATFPTTTTVRLVAREPETFLDFLGPVVHGVTVDGREVPVDFDGARIRLHGLPTGVETTVTVRAEGAYSRSGEGLHRFVDPVDGETYLYTQYEPADARRVFANAEQPDLKARFTFEVLAPAPWHVLSNSAPERVEDVAPEPGSPDDAAPDDAVPARRWTFAPTPPLSTYLTAVVAGPYHRVEGTWSVDRADGTRLEVPLSVACRRSLAEHLDAEEILAITRQGLTFFDAAFGFPYPWGTYEQVFVPEYNLGAMENPGAVTFTEAYVFRSAATDAQYQARANTILHEMAHMWFGDLVTMRWWDDLWLKESFADYMGAHASVAATRFTDAWTAFASRRKAWAYRQDQLPTTHPVVADIPDLEAAKQNFDGITYAKGASVLKQLVAYVGEDAFFAGARAYFRAHAYGNTTLPDLLGALEGASGRDLGAWSRAWLETAGTSTLTADVEAGGEGSADDGARVSADDGAPVIRRLRLHQAGTDPATGAEVLRPHRLAVGFYDLEGGQLRRSRRIELDLTEGTTTVEEAEGLRRPDLLLVNDDDLTYAKVRLDPTSLRTALAHLGALPEALPRALVWSALWNATRDGILPAGDYLAAVLAHAAREDHVGTLRDITAHARFAVEHYLPPAARDEGRRTLFEGAWQHLERAAPGSDAQLVWARVVAAAAASCPGAAPRVRGLLDGGVVVAGLPLDPDLRWALWQALAAVGDAQVGELDAELARERTAATRTSHLAALVGRPDAEVKAEAWRSLVEQDALSNDEVDATIEGFTQPLHASLVAPWTEPYFTSLRRLWEERSIEIAARLVRGLYPGQQGAAVLARTRAWLEANDDAPAALRRILLEEEDDLRRALAAQTSGTSEAGR
ncbi:aminopeptidase N [Georgenia faecalis]|uniref:Aminopeptidase N n=1 Tax=Georgenia faecalis TaxID=2483799 RepID=A0ABV9D8X1_9MICO|nr:aminopeptidase N [Georgenia faecalis]